MAMHRVLCPGCRRRNAVILALQAESVDLRKELDGLRERPRVTKEEYAKGLALRALEAHIVEDEPTEEPAEQWGAFTRTYLPVAPPAISVAVETPPSGFVKRWIVGLFWRPE